MRAIGLAFAGIATFSAWSGGAVLQNRLQAAADGDRKAGPTAITEEEKAQLAAREALNPELASFEAGDDTASGITLYSFMLVLGAIVLVLLLYLAVLSTLPSGA